ncbi:hypothetical protein [Caenimonas soli]|uniref:hypothetical protein n=1 Tax=Caenimonas soli TaxID=2735555 RepID=UPI001557B4A0|nr:hypothetical protein [Caenimonas soli]NPC57041.1 hypothetical protein [Caenimonas soli]
MKKYGVITLAAGAVALMLVGCGGGGGGTAEQPSVPVQAASLQLSGTAATGLALASSTVDVRCASGTGAATTNEAGAYTVTITDGALPCMIKVTGQVDGVTVTLHSVTETGTTSGSTTTAVANVTPLTELIVAQLAAAAPAAYFDSFGAGSTITTEQLAAATTTLLSTLKTATGIDLGTIDPFKSTLVPATATTEGNAYDDALESLKAKVSLESLPLVVNQVASASAASTGGGSAPITLTEVLTAANAGSLANCPAAISGKYRVIDYRGATQVVQFDFSNNTLTDGTDTFAVTPNASQPCEVSVAGTVTTTVVFGPNGVGALRDAESTGYIFPVQSLSYEAIVGDWSFVESGVDETGTRTHFVGKITLNADRTGAVCDYDVMGGITSACTADDETPTVSDRTDGGLQLNYGDTPGRIYGYRTPAGTLTLFGTSNAEGSSSLGVMQSHFIAYKAQPAVLPALNTVRKSWDASMVNGNSGLTRETQTITAVDTVNQTYTRVRESAPTVSDVFAVNQPVSGMIARAQRPVYGFALPGLGVTVAVNAPGNTNFIYSTTVIRP